MILISRLKTRFASVKLVVDEAKPLVNLTTTPQHASGVEQRQKTALVHKAAARINIQKNVDAGAQAITQQTTAVILRGRNWHP